MDRESFLVKRKLDPESLPYTMEIQAILSHIPQFTVTHVQSASPFKGPLRLFSFYDQPSTTNLRGEGCGVGVEEDLFLRRKFSLLIKSFTFISYSTYYTQCFTRGISKVLGQFETLLLSEEYVLQTYQKILEV